MNVTLTPIGGANRSTRLAAAVEMGNQKWRRWLDIHDQLARQTVEGHRG
jgi:hypothetical protein